MDVGDPWHLFSPKHLYTEAAVSRPGQQEVRHPCVPGLLFTPAWVHSLGDFHINQVSFPRPGKGVALDPTSRLLWRKGIRSVIGPISLCFLKGISGESVFGKSRRVGGSEPGTKKALTPRILRKILEF